MNPRTQSTSIDGVVGPIEVALDAPPDGVTQRGLAVVCHPHPLFGGSLNNKVTQTLARALVSLGFYTVRPNFRGVGQTAGEHDEGRGEVEDILQVVQTFKQRTAAQEVVLAGFSFGSFVQTHVAQRLAESGQPAQRLILVGTAVSRWEVLPVPDDTLVIHGELDDTVTLASVFDWARPQQLPVIVIPGADHFFHGRLPIIKRLVTEALQTHHA